MDEVEELNKMLSNNKFDRNVLLSILDSFSDNIALVPLILPSERKIIRCRINNNDLFHSVKDLSYPPNAFAKTDRASIEGCPMFYGSIFASGTEIGESPRSISYFETKDITKNFERRFVTHSAWLSYESLKVFAFPFSMSYEITCDEISQILNMWNDLKHIYPESSRTFFEYIGELLSQEKHSCLYEITSMCVQYAVIKGNYDGILYPSVPAKGAGLNLCLTPKAVDNKIKFIGAVTERIKKNNSTSNIIIENLYDSVLGNDGLSLDWKKTMFR